MAGFRRIAPWIAMGALIGAGGAFAGKWVWTKLQARTNPPTYQLRDDILVHGNVNLKEVALTFDDGPHPETARPILDALAQRGARATFFVVGKQIDQHPALVRRMLNEGHEVGNHSYTHLRLDTLDADGIRQEIAKTNHAFQAATGSHMFLFRPPGMRYNADVLRTAQDLGYATIHWNVAAQDYAPQPPRQIAAKVLRNTQPGSVILLHLQPDTAKALPVILDTLKSRGYRFVTVSQMMGRLPRPVIVKSNAWDNRISEPVSPPRFAAAKRPSRSVRKSRVQPPTSLAPAVRQPLDVPVSG